MSEDAAVIEATEEWPAADEARRMWEEASHVVNLDHPYLVKKKITEVEIDGLRQLGDMLLVPMRALAEGSPLVNLQRIWPDGKKLYLPGSRKTRTRTTIGADYLVRDDDGVPVPRQPLYLCEGWATGWSISYAMEAPVIVAFDISNLKHVYEYLVEQYVRGYQLDLILAADNDRWSGDNPGVTIARQLAYPPFGRVAIPDFKPEHIELKEGQKKGPTDFNDLYVLEGHDAVRYWCDPDHASEAVTTTASRPLADEPEQPEQEDVPLEEDPWHERAPFRCLGYNHGTYFYLPKGTGQVTTLTPSQHQRHALLPLAPITWWEQQFPANNGVSWMTAADALLRQSERVGVYRPERSRGRGCWPENGAGQTGILVHLGDRILAPDAKRWMRPEQYASPRRFIYQREHRLEGPAEREPLTLEEARAVLDLFESLLWKDAASGFLSAGWTVLAPVCGALTWRPHIWLTGERGAGKSAILEQLITPLLADMVLRVVGQTSEAGIRQELGADALAVTFDEAEESEEAGRRIQSVLALARQASSESGARTLKGTTHGSAIHYRIRSMFCLASIGGALKEESDKSRVSLLSLRGPSQVEREERHEHWARLQPKLQDVDEQLGRRLIARTLKLLRSGMLPETVRIFRHVAARALGEARTGDQYGTLYAGAWCLMADEPPGEDEAREMIQTEDLTSYQEDHIPEGKKALGILFQQIERVDTKNGPKNITVGQLVDVCCGQMGPVTVEEADTHLRNIGLKVDIVDGAHVLYVANTSEWIQSVLRNTIYSRGIRTVLLSLPGVQSGPQIRFSGFKSRTTSVPRVAFE